MAAIHWLGGTLGACAVIITGGNLYADQKLKDFYQHSTQSSGLSIKSNEFDMGLFSGHAKSTVEFILDPCKPNDKISFQVTDQISRGIFGYTSTSKINYSDEIKGDLQKFFGSKEPLIIKTSLNWLGNANVNISSPAINHKDGTFFLNSKGLDLTFDSSNKDIHLLKNIVLNAPSFSVGDHENYFSMDKLHMTANQVHTSQIIDDSDIHLSLNLMRIKTFGPYPQDINIEKISTTSQTNINKNLLNVSNQFKVGKFSMPNTNKTGNLQFNLDIKDIDSTKLQTMYTTIEDTSKTCQADSDQKIMQAMLDIFEQGVKIESKNNLIKIGETTLASEFSANLSKGQYDNIEMFAAAAPMQFTAEGRVDTSRAFILELLKLNPRQAAQADAQVDQVIAQLQSQGMLKQEGQKITSKFEYKYGAPRFTN